MKILMVDTGIREESRTRELAELVASYLPGEKEYVKVAELVESVENKKGTISFLSGEKLKIREEAKETDDWSHPMFAPAHQFAQADYIVIEAPFWDMSFPALLKMYIETISVSGITFKYCHKGYPVGRSKAKHLFYVTTAGGPIIDDCFGYGYIKYMAETFYGIPKVHKFAAENLDIIGADVNAIMEEARKNIRKTMESMEL